MSQIVTCCQVLRNGSLWVGRVEEGDGGWYECHGNDVSRTIFLDVRGEQLFGIFFVVFGFSKQNVFLIKFFYSFFIVSRFVFFIL